MTPVSCRGLLPASSSANMQQKSEVMTGTSCIAGFSSASCVCASSIRQSCSSVMWVLCPAVSGAHHVPQQACGRGAGQPAGGHHAVPGLGKQEGHKPVHQLLWRRCENPLLL